MPAVRDLAKEYLRPYVERGDSPKQFCKGHLAAFDAQNALQIGGQADVNGTRKQIGNDRLAITRFEGRDYFTIYSVEELWEEIRQELASKNRPRQLTLW